MENGTIKNLVPYIADAAIKAGIAVAIDEDGNEIKGSKKSNSKQDGPGSNKVEKNKTDNKSQEEINKGDEIKALTITHENALEASMEAEETSKAAEEASKADPDNEDLKLVHYEAAGKWTELTGVTEKAEAALNKAKEGVDTGWLAKLFGGK